MSHNAMPEALRIVRVDGHLDPWSNPTAEAVAVTGNEITYVGDAAGAQALIPKPVDGDALLGVLNRCLGTAI